MWTYPSDQFFAKKNLRLFTKKWTFFSKLPNLISILTQSQYQKELFKQNIWFQMSCDTSSLTIFFSQLSLYVCFYEMLKICVFEFFYEV